MHCKQHYESISELNSHRQKGSEGIFHTNDLENKFSAELVSISKDQSDDDNDNSDHFGDNYDDDNDIDTIVENIAAAKKNTSIENDFCDKEPKYSKSIGPAKKAVQNKPIVETVIPLTTVKDRWLFKCNLCGLGFSKKPNLLRHHANKHTDSLPFECYMCREAFQFRYLLIEHFRIHPISESALQEFAAAKEAERLERKKEKKIHKCKVCSRSYTSKSELRRHHERAHSDKRPHSCQACGESYKYKYQLNAHLLTHAGKLHECSLCHKMLMTKSDLDKHMKNHSLDSKAGNDTYKVKKMKLMKNLSQYRYKCDICAQTFKQKLGAREHRLIHFTDQEQPFECFLCHKTFKYPRPLRQHMKSHIFARKKKGTCICELCGKVFTHVNFLEDHQTVHSDIRPHKCAICGLGYKTKRLLNSHHISHTEFQHKCTECGKSYRKKASLKMHMETHTGVISKPFVCDGCGKGFRKNCDLVEHRRLHTGEKPHGCEFCGLKFRTMSGYYTHLKKVHDVSVSARNREEQKRLTAMS